MRLYLLFEHQSSVDLLMPFRVLRYEVRIWERDLIADPDARTLVPIVPVVLHHSEGGWTAATRFEALLALGVLAGTGIEAFLPHFSLILDDVSEASDEEIAARTTTVVVRLVLATLREARRSGDAVRITCSATSWRRAARARRSVEFSGIF